MSDTPDARLKKKGADARVTLRLSEREQAVAREEDLTSVIREAIGSYLNSEKAEAAHDAQHQRLAVQVATNVKREADRVIERHEQTTRALIEALNAHLTGKPAAAKR